MKENDTKRRSFLKQLVAGSAIVAGSALVGSKKAKAREAQESKRPEEILYKKSEAFQKYYDSLR